MAEIKEQLSLSKHRFADYSVGNHLRYRSYLTGVYEEFDVIEVNNFEKLLLIRCTSSIRPVKDIWVRFEHTDLSPF